jgi:hypothetical protein
MGKWKPSHQLDHDLRTDPAFIGELKRHAEAIAATARTLAPADSGEYRDSITVDVRAGSTGRRRVAVLADDHKASWIEFGTVKQKKRAVLRKAAVREGLKFRAGRKRKK